LSSPSTPKNPANHHLINNFSSKNSWHSSYAPPDKIEGVEIKKASSPAFLVGLLFFSLYAETTPKTSHPEPKSSSFWPGSSPFRA
jgi:hypothetical protein